MSIKTVNLEKNMPTGDAAVARLKLELMTLRRMGVDCVKVVHGYGSSGTGGAIKLRTRECLRNLQTEGRVKYFCPGESFGPFENDGRKAIEMKPTLRSDRDWARSNDGITIVIL
ncbi:MAG: Smr/MutS family protein [Saccharofermentanales bacterium]